MGTQGTPVVTLDGKPDRRGRGGHEMTVAGRLTLSANSAFSAAPIENFFRKCVNIEVNVGSGWLVAYKGSRTQNGFGLIKVFGLGSTKTQGPNSSLNPGTPGAMNATFTATGF